MNNRFLILLFFASLASAGAQQDQNAANSEIHILPVRGNIYMLVGAGANITVSAGQDGVLLVDTGSPAMARQVLAAVRRLQAATATNGVDTLRYGAEGRSALRAIADTKQPPKPIRYIIDTSV